MENFDQESCCPKLVKSFQEQMKRIMCQWPSNDATICIFGQ